LAEISNFQHYEFLLPQTVADGFVALQAETIHLGTNADFTVDFEGGYSSLLPGDTITLLNATAIDGNIVPGEKEGNIGYLFLYNYEVSKVGDEIIATVATAPRVIPEVKIITETSAARLAFVNQGQDFIADQAIALAKSRSATERGLGVFVGVSGGKSRYDTGSHVDLSGVNTIIGVSRSNYFDQNRLTVGVFGEFGFGSYESFVPSAGNRDMKAEGDVSYVGGGVLGRYDIQSSAGTVYLEASGRIGNSKAEFLDKTFVLQGRRAKFDTSGTYFGAHAGVGYDMRASEEISLDVFFKYLWSRQNSTDQDILGAKFTLDEAYSSRIKTGVRVNYNYNDFIKPYVGGSYVYEFAGDTEASAYGLNLPHAELKGSSAQAELGVTLLNSDTLPISLDAGVQGYFGHRRGMSGSLDIKYEF
ncbi:MAG: autotransporter outer membrane beta-barrel domain-containing protein, partial [Deltaproteobacteria bacterium]|nr:autotransporter outer membrane beta-barrel domain-containing protein [Deltaproteobacteria bacterium]